MDPHILRGIELFTDLDDDALRAIAASATTRELSRGDIVFGEGDTATEMFIVTAGRLAIVNKSIDDRESMVALMEAGDPFGEMPIFDGQGRSAEARALEASAIISIPYEPIREIYEQNPVLLWGVVRLLSNRLRNMDAALADSVFLDVTGRTAKRLLELAGESDSFSLPITQEELAGMVGASRERVNKAIASFVKLGWLDQRDRQYHITNREQMEIRAR